MLRGVRAATATGLTDWTLEGLSGGSLAHPIRAVINLAVARAVEDNYRDTGASGQKLGA